MAMSRMPTQWLRNASRVNVWKISWKPNLPGERVGPLQPVDDRARGVEKSADEDERHGDRVRIEEVDDEDAAQPIRAGHTAAHRASAARG